jgi:hypothetical protein
LAVGDVIKRIEAPAAAEGSTGGEMKIALAVLAIAVASPYLPRMRVTQLIQRSRVGLMPIYASIRSERPYTAEPNCQTLKLRPPIFLENGSVARYSNLL